MGLFSAVASAVGGAAGNLYNDYRNRTAQKREYKYNSWLQQENIDFQKYMASNAHQLEMQDLEKAGINPAVTAMNSTAGSIAGSSASQGTSTANGTPLDIMSMLSNIVGMENQTSATEAQAGLQKAEALRIIEMLPLEKREKEGIVKNLGLTGENIKEDTKYKGYFPITTSAGTSFFGTGGTSTQTRYVKKH